MVDAVAEWFRATWVTICLNWRRVRTLGLKNIMNERRLPHAARKESVLLPFDEEILFKQWVVIRDSGQIAVVDHIKSDGRLGVRPVDPITAAYLPNTSKHWSWEDRIRIPHELALPPGKVRAATSDEIPSLVRGR